MSLSPAAKRSLRLHAVAYGFLGPAIIILVVFRLWPIVEALRVSLTNLNTLSGVSRFVGSANYARAVADVGFRHSLLITVEYAAMYVPAQTVLGLALALVAQRPVRGIGLVRGALFLPVVTSMVIASAIWSMIYHPTNGLLNGLLAVFGLPAQFFLGNAGLALPAVTAVTIWKDIGFTIIIYLAGLQSIPAEYYEAARVDGAGTWAVLRRITLPLLKRSTIFVVIISTIFSFQLYTPIYVMTKGGPLDSTKVAVYYMWEQAFSFLEVGYASAIAMIFLLIVLAIIMIQLKLTTSDVEY